VPPSHSMDLWLVYPSLWSPAIRTMSRSVVYARWTCFMKNRTVGSILDCRQNKSLGTEMQRLWHRSRRLQVVT
ncbi:MAG: hypothetical protein V1792_07810, partial [Pseudomonadota bacterium]